MDYLSFYQKISKPFNKQIINVINKVSTVLMYVLYPLLLGYLFIVGSDKFLKILMVPAVSFILVTVFRKALNAPRPYDLYDINPMIIRDGKGNSMPSRHIFSATIIAMAFLSVNKIVGIILLVVSAIEACVRVIGGVHFPKDVVAGYLIGIICGLLMIF